MLEEIVNRRVQEILQAAAITRRDFALKTNGGVIACSFTTNCPFWPFSLWTPTLSLAITESDRTGDCWLVHAQHAQIGVVLSQPVYPTHVTIDHALNQVADVNEAPRSMILWGLVDGESNWARFKSLDIIATGDGISTSPLSRQTQKFVPLASFVYDVSRSPSQTFAVFDHIRLSRMDFTTVVLEIRNNWGSEKTCLYRMRIHGEPVAGNLDV
ncbi:hypothetical protein BDY19DRAFT_900599 [Irpex rosettiformis]|uniref:Uncharacterized protein n=1 Tax=Irpex rosettiformis TaxID=378272 RepID=A0ACB8TMP1_9APHY|nr:hypothetical protein BDY19DRAFT_900599 [Irpex rosettiformis]